jgi:hypothetical protein
VDFKAGRHGSAIFIVRSMKGFQRFKRAPDSGLETRFPPARIELLDWDHG